MEEFEIIDFMKYDQHKDIKKIKFRKTNCYIIPCTINKKNKKLSHQFVEGQIMEANISLDINTWLNDIKNSYKDQNSIIKQFMNDYDRCTFFCNGHQVTNPNSFIDYLDNKCNKKQINQILMLCSQTSLGFPFELIQYSLYENSKQEYFLAEVAYSDRKYYQRYRIFFNLKDDNIEFTITKYLRIFKIVNTSDVTVANVEIFINFNLKNKDVILKILYKPIKRHKSS
jgi:hypothetical protein